MSAVETLEQALDRHGFTYQRLEKLARKALSDHCRQRGITLDPQRAEEALDHLLRVGERWAFDYQPELANGQSFTTTCYRRMVRRPTDFLRRRHGDERRGTPLHEVTGETVPDRSAMDEESFEQLVESVSGGLTTRALFSLRQIGHALCVEGLQRWEIAERLEIPVGDIDEFLEEVGWQLRSTLRPAA